MQAVVKTPRTEIAIRGEISDRLLSVLVEEFGDQFQVSENEQTGVETVSVFDTSWYKGVKASMAPGENLRFYRENRGLTQAELGEELGGVPRQHVSNMERGTRSISLKTTRKLARLFRVSPDKFI